MRLVAILLLPALALAQYPTNGASGGAAASLTPIVISASGALLSGTYTSGITTTGTVGQTCLLTALNGAGSAATASVALTGTNAIAGGTALVITAAGSGYASAPTSSTASAGTAAACSGTAVIATVVSVAPTFPGSYFDNMAGALTYVLPVITTNLIGAAWCFRNYAPRTGAITLRAPASTYIDKSGALGTVAGTLVSGGAAGDASCVVAIDSTHYAATVSLGTWTNN